MEKVAAEKRENFLFPGKVTRDFKQKRDDKGSFIDNKFASADDLASGWNRLYKRVIRLDIYPMEI